MEHFNTHSSNINFSDYIYFFSSNYLFIFVCNHGRDVNVLGVELFFISLYEKKTRFKRRESFGRVQFHIALLYVLGTVKLSFLPVHLSRKCLTDK